MNAYDRIYRAIRSAGAEASQDGAVRIRLGTVLSAEPLKVEVAGTNQEGARFYVAHRLLSGHKENVSLNCSGVSGSLQILASCALGSHDGMLVLSGTLSTEAVTSQAGPVLRAGDQVLLLTDDDQTFYLVDKVVRMS